MLSDPHDRTAVLYLGRTERDAGRLNEGLAVVKRELSRDPTWLAGAAMVLELSGLLGRREDARKILDGIALTRLSPKERDRLLRTITQTLPDVAADAEIALSAQDTDDDRTAARAAAAIAASEDANGRLGLARRLGAAGGDAARAEAVKLHLGEGRIAEARELADQIAVVRCRAGREAARALSGAGFPSQAADLLGRAGDEPRAGRLLARIEAQLRVLRGWRPRVEGRGVRSIEGRVLHVCHASILDQVSGYTVRTHRVARAQQASGIDASVMTLAGFGGGNDGGEPSEALDGVTYHRLGPANARELPTDERLQVNAELASELVAEFRPAVLHASSDYQNATVALALREATRIPVIYEVRGFWEETWLARQPAGAEDSDAYKMRREVNQACMRDADHVITLSESMKRELIARGVDADQVTVVPHTVEPDELYPVDCDAELAARLGIRPGEFVVGYVGSLLAYEGLDLVVEAVAALRDRGDPVHCLLVGGGPEQDGLRTLVEELGIESHVHLVGAVPQSAVRAYFGLLDAFAMPRLDRRVCRLVTPLKPYEAMATATPLIVSDLEPLREIVGDRATGLIVEPESSGALAEAIAELATDPDLARNLGELGRQQTLDQRGAWTRVAGIYEDLARA